MKRLTLAIASLLYAAAAPLAGAGPAHAAALQPTVLAEAGSSGDAGSQGASGSDSSGGQASGDQAGADQSSGGAGASYGDSQSGQPDTGQSDSGQSDAGQASDSQSSDQDGGQTADQSAASSSRASSDASLTNAGDILLGLLAILVIATLVLAVVLVPAIIAFSRRHTYKWVIAILCFLGPLWIVAIVWSLWPDEGAKAGAIRPLGPSYPAPAPTSLPPTGYSTGSSSASGLGVRSPPKPMVPSAGPAPSEAPSPGPIMNPVGFSQPMPAAVTAPVPAAVAAPSPPGRGLTSEDVDRLARLGALRESGALTEAEFESEKRKILGGS